MTGGAFHVELGVEELCLAISIAGNPEMAKALLYSTFGDMQSEHEAGRLLAAGHSLMARGLLSVRDGRSLLDGEFRRHLDTIVDCDFAVRCARKSSDSEEVQSYFVKGAAILRQEIRQGVAYDLSTAADEDTMVAGSLGFFGVREEGDIIDAPELRMPMSVLDRAKQASAESPEWLSKLFEDAGIPDHIGRQLAADFLNSDYRGTVTRIDKRDGQLVSDRGFLVLKGAARIWLFPAGFDGEPYAKLVSGTRRSFIREMRELLARQ